MSNDNFQLSNLKRFAKIIIQVLFVLAVFFFLGRVLFLNWSRLEIDFSKFNYGWFFLSIVLFGVSLLSYAYAWKIIMRFLGERIAARRAVKIWYWSQAPRYIPGSVWQIFGRIYFGGKEGISKGKVIVSIAIETSFLIVSSTIVFLISLFFWWRLPTNLPIYNLGLYLSYLVVGTACFAFLHPFIFNKVSNFFLHRLDKTKDIRYQFTFTDILQMFIPFIFVWLLTGLGAYSLFLSLKIASLSLLPVFIGTFAISWSIGFLFVIAPAGLGARELVIVSALSLYMIQPLAVAVALLARVVLLVEEILILVISSRF